MNDLAQLPVLFWLSLASLAWLVWLGWTNRNRGWGFPMMAVSITVVAWYHGDVIYNGYQAMFIEVFPDRVLDTGWLQVCVFAISFGILARWIPDRINCGCQGRTSVIVQLATGRRSVESLQPPIEQLSIAVSGVWGILSLTALWRAQWDVIGWMAPYLEDTGSPWGRGQLAASWGDSFAALSGSVAVLCAALFGVCAAVLKKGPVRLLMQVLMALSWPAYFFDRTRHIMLLVLLPGLLTYAGFRLRGRRVTQFILLAGALLAVNLWFKFVIENRTGTTIGSAFKTKRSHLAMGLEETKHLGLNMFEELCWLNYLMDTGEFTPKAGQLYFANLVNPIPRAIWPGKPTIGLDYAIARGQGGDVSSGVTATIATGMIGSGIVNFGRVVGPVSAAFLMTLWCAFLARLDLTGQDLGRVLIYIVGYVSIFNFGRDITLLVAYPTLFGFGLLWLYRKARPAYGTGGVRQRTVSKLPHQRRRVCWRGSTRASVADEQRS